MIALRTFDEMPCVPALPPKLLAILLKDVSDRCFYSPRLPQSPLDPHAACVSLSLSTMSISNPVHTQSAQNPGSPSQDIQNIASTSKMLRQQSTPRISAAPLSDPAYKTHKPIMSTAISWKTAEM
jgi:hypothetical protein